MTARAELLAALIEERHPAEAIEAERCDLRRPADVRIAATPAAPTVADTDLATAARRRDLARLATDEPPVAHAPGTELAS